jgi:hypothetical protein
LLEQTGSYFGVDEAVRYAVSAGFEGIAATYWLSGELSSLIGHQAVLTRLKLVLLGQVNPI